MDKQYKISFCTTCKGRLSHLQKTLPVNLKNNADYPNTEFVILDYDSQDGLKQWVEENFKDEIKSGKIRYAHFTPAPFFKMAHAKNMAHRVATGDVLCNLDADNITVPGFASWLNKKFSADPNVVIHMTRRGSDMRRVTGAVQDKTGRFAMKVHSVMGAPCTKPPEEVLKKSDPSGITGRISISRHNFLRLRGYDENYRGWGNDDINLLDRAYYAGIRSLGIPLGKLGDVIHHDNVLRTVQMAPEDKKTSDEYIHNHAGPSTRPLAKKILSRLQPEKHENPPAANMDGAFGCGRVIINGEEQIIAPVKVSKASRFERDENFGIMQPTR